MINFLINSRNDHTNIINSYCLDKEYWVSMYLETLIDFIILPKSKNIIFIKYTSKINRSLSGHKFKTETFTTDTLEIVLH